MIIHPLLTSNVATIPAERGWSLSLEEDYWNFYAVGELSKLDKILDPEFRDVEEQIWNKRELLDFVKKFHTTCQLIAPKLTEVKLQMASATVAVVVYRVHETPSCNGRQLSGDVNASSVWVQESGKWKLMLHTEYPVGAR